MTGKDPNVTVNPDEVVALGAAVQAGVLAGGPAALLCWGRVLGGGVGGVVTSSLLARLLGMAGCWLCALEGQRQQNQSFGRSCSC